MGPGSRAGSVALLAAGVFASLASHALAEERAAPDANGSAAAVLVAPRASSTTSSPGAPWPGFETLTDGSTRLFVELARPVPYQTKVARGGITFVLKGARVDRRNNFNPLVTVHFNTPVTSARLVPHGRDLWFVVALRAAVTPSVVIDPGKDGRATLRIDFPKGQYLPAPSSPSAGAPVAGGPPAGDEAPAR